MKCRKKLLLAAALCAAGMHGVFGFTSQAAVKTDYLKSVTYFGDEWPINYWNSEDNNMEENFSKIAADGFNSIILVIPWREFQPMMVGNWYNQAAFDRLDEVMASASRHGLSVMLRVGYTWDYYDSAGVPQRYENIVYEGSAEREAWLDYCKKLYETASAHENFSGGFMTWEDFWNFTSNMDGDLTMGVRLKMASGTGYTKYLASHYSLEEIGKKYNRTFKDYSEIYIPYRSTNAAELFYEFYDQFLLDLLAETQTVFPDLSMEVRADADRIYNADGTYEYYSHSATYSCGNAPYSALMYSVSMGQRNESNKISASAALKAMEQNMLSLCNASGKKYYVEQLLYMDSTAAFCHNTQITENEVGTFVSGLAPILEATTTGYGIWVYRNYVNNCVYNSQFALGEDGWEFKGGAKVTEHNGTKMARFDSTGKIVQDLSDRLSKADKLYARFYAEADKGQANVTVRLGDYERKVYVSSPGVYSISIPWQSSWNFEISAAKGVYVDDIKVYSVEQNGRIYDKDGNETDLAGAFRELNSRLP